MNLIIKSNVGRKPVLSQLGSGLHNNKSQTGAGALHIRGTNSRQPASYVSKTPGKVR